MGAKFPDFDIKELEQSTEQDNYSGVGDEGLSNSLIDGNKDIKSDGQLIDSSINQGLFAFNPEMMVEKLVEDFNNAKKIYGESMIKLVSGDDPNAIKKNIRFPEYKRELKSKINKKIEDMKEEGLIDDDGVITEKGFELASLVAYMEELDDLESKGVGDWKAKRISLYGEKKDIKNYKKGDRYRDIALKRSIKQAIRRGHKNLDIRDLKTFERDAKGKIYLIYGLDASGSMKGKKIAMCKKAGIALAYKAIEQMDKVGLLVFGSDIQERLEPTSDFGAFLKAIAHVKAKKQTDIALTIENSLRMFPNENVTKHLVLITDAVPTAGDEPKRETLNLVEKAANLGITISVIGVGIDEEGEEMAKRIVDIGNGRLYIIKDLENLDRIVLENYYNL